MIEMNRRHSTLGKDSIKRLWWLIGVGGRIVIALFVALMSIVFLLPFFASLPREFANLSGEQAASRLEGHFPEGVTPNEIEKASGKIYSQIDCHAGWFLIVLPPETATKWQDAIHTELEKSSRRSGGSEFVEGVHREVTKPLVTTTRLGEPPRWWKPPSLEFRATEKMKWSAGGTTYANALYSAFDPSTKQLWIFDYGQQHDRLWARGDVPAGRKFSLGDAKTHDPSNEETPGTDTNHEE